MIQTLMNHGNNANGTAFSGGLNSAGHLTPTTYRQRYETHTLRLWTDKHASVRKNNGKQTAKHE